MNRQDLEHIIRAVADVTNEYEFIIVSSQFILGPISFRSDMFKITPPMTTMDCRTAKLPRGWEDRRHRGQHAETNDWRSLCLDVIDLFMCKTAANR